MSSEEPRPLRTLTDPKAMRAIAHPTRIALLEALGRDGALTATEAAAVVGESPTNCAFHLRTLAKYGFVEEAGGGTGRRRPWQLKHVGFRFDEDTVEANALAGFLWETWLARLAKVAGRRASFSEEWRKATSASETVLYLTPEEAKAFHEGMADLVLRYHNRMENPALRPPDSLPLEHIQFTYPYDAVR
ncbi:helix-turn-helix domain-containing protein [Streptacidiphilus sp. N1-10]|uniref:Helix-turn-helix domain-containing protein n=1 Tax=Streptacidiphilus jeojiensis TaxID=3229225 RepID=A0ABV6XY67_9ACTN